MPMSSENTGKEFPTLDGKEVFELAGGYPVMRKLGEGGMGRVFACRDQALGRVVAVKEMLPERVKDPDMVARFLREARAMAKVSSPHVASIFHVGDGTEEQLPYIVMEYLEGEDLESRMERTGNVPLARTFDYIRDAIHGLRAAQAAGLVHRDVKPANLFVVDGRVVLTDFGLAKPVDGSGDLTQKGLIAGSPHYMPPERALSGEEDHRGDIYALGATWYAILSGKPPFKEKATPVDVIMGHMNEEPKPLDERAPHVPPAVVKTIAKMMAKDPADRPATYDELLEEINLLAKRMDPDGVAHTPLQQGRPPVPDTPPPSGVSGVAIRVAERMSQATKTVVSRPGVRLGAAAAVALLVIAIAAVVLLSTSQEDMLVRIDKGEAQVVLDEIERMPASERGGEELLLKGHALAKLGKDHAALAAYEDAAELGTVDDRVLDFALGELDKRKADTAIKLLIAWPDDRATSKLYTVADSVDWWPRHHAVRVLTERGEDGDVDRTSLAIRDLESGPKCKARRYGLRQLAKIGKGEAALKAIDAAAKRDDNGCMKRELKSTRRAVLER
jgi:hypothetical protein